ncbi:MAG: 6,7-dimethyl-8-ribityllumazine synthase [Micavibrio sp.]|nr:6,7-dimethyl-8-ribityllumazine synthase [Micavibrio sp.]
MSAKIAVLSATWHADIVNSAENSFIEEMKKLGYDTSQIDVIKVPGALEIPLTGKMTLENGYDIAVGISFIVNGQFYHHEFVAHTVVQSILDVSIATNKPFLSVCLTPQGFNENSDIYEEMYVKHMVGKGREAAKACAHMLDLTQNFPAAKKAA